jgi:16S rRNA G966 N2-methylase RsmD
MPRLTVIYKDPKALRPRDKNPRKHPKRQIDQLKRSITEFGFVRPVLLDASDGIIAGHGSTLAAIELGMTDIPTVRVDHLSPEQIRAYVIADNKLAENAGWDRELLTLELKELSLNFDITLTGFELPEFDLLLDEFGDPGTDAADEIPDVDRGAAITQTGDLWQIGEHFLLCGDSTKRESYETLLRGAKAQAIFTDPPYNVRIAGNVSGLGKTVHQEFAMASGEMTPEEFTTFLGTVFGHLVGSSVDGSLHYICMDWRHMREILDSAGAYSELKNLCVWAKTNAGMGSLYRSQHELVFVFKHGTAGHINNVELGRFGRNRTNVWTYAGVNTFGKDREAELAMHPTVKPVALVADAILDCSHRGGIVLDAFAGSGSTLIAAEKTGRRGYGIEIDPRYVDTIIRRFGKVYGLEANHALTGESFEVVMATRRKVGAS